MKGFGPRPLPAAMDAIVRAEATDRSSRSSTSGSPSHAKLYLEDARKVQAEAGKLGGRGARRARAVEKLKEPKLK
jgi:hypothetical protein